MGKIIAKRLQRRVGSMGMVAAQNDHNDKWRVFLGKRWFRDIEVAAKYIRDRGVRMPKGVSIMFFPHLPANKFDWEFK